ncbi:MAG TPA: Gfo/Idh/MocA family oxidoreductase, partial [Chthoniobacterales bacterium]|nr:Gfo/Idh/MocA family oxidoreductase [Chthoniobacterales bacterium]
TMVRNLLAAGDIEIVLNLTLPATHAEVSRAAIAAGKHVYSEKPLATSLQDAIALMEEAEAKDLRVGCAPDTILGAGLQTAKALIDEGRVGPIITGLAAVMTKGMEHWHPNPAPFYQKGAGPVLDLGPYYVSALTALLGPVSELRAVGQISPVERRFGEGPKKGETFPVGTFTTLNSILTFSGGAIVSFLASWDVWRHGVRPIELHGTLASIRVPDPDTFGGDVEISANNRLLNIHDPSSVASLSGQVDWLIDKTDEKPFGGINYPLGNPVVANYRSLGLAEMANAIVEGRPHRCSGRFALHALAVMLGIIESAESSQTVKIGVPGTTSQRLTEEDARRLLL